MYIFILEILIKTYIPHVYIYFNIGIFYSKIKTKLNILLHIIQIINN